MVENKLSRKYLPFIIGYNESEGVGQPISQPKKTKALYSHPQRTPVG
jgi:hypothetical protein